MVRAMLIMLGMLGAAIAQSSVYTGPMFDPGNAPFFGASSLVIPTLSNAVPTTEVTPTFIRSRVSSAASAAVSSSALVSSPASRNATVSATASFSTSASASASASSVALSSSASQSSSLTTSASRTASATSSASAPAQSTGAAFANVPGVVGVILGGVFAGLATL